MPTITGTVRDAAAQLFVGTVFFENLDAPCSGGAFVVGPAETVANTDAVGALPSGFTLAPGRVRFKVNGRWSKTFTVPQGNGTYDLAELMASAASLRTQVIVNAATIAELREYPSQSNYFSATVLADANGAYSVFRWDASATNADDEASYIRPDDFETAGLWVRVL